MKTCSQCDGQLALLGALGRTKHFRCVNCGAQFSQTPRAPKARKVKTSLSTSGAQNA
jgi:tRNA(Ile2) C34 agmatinyltransferase TiaS